MSAQLDSLLDRQRLCDIASHEPANESGPLMAFRVSVKRGSVVVRSFEAMAVDSLAATSQHLCLCGDGEKLDVRAIRDDLERAIAQRRDV